MRVTFYVRAITNELDDETENRIIDRLSYVLQDAPGWDILTIGRSYYHENATCIGHADINEPCDMRKTSRIKESHT